MKGCAKRNNPVQSDVANIYLLLRQLGNEVSGTW